MSDQANNVSMDVSESASAGDGRLYWRSMEGLGGSPEYEKLLHDEFQIESPDQPPTDGVSRRRFLGLVAAAVGMAGTTACRKPYRKILPHSKRPEDMAPGVPQLYATSFSLDGYATGTLIRSFDGRPIKVEGNPLHPANPGGGTSLYSQGELLNLYDPARSKSPMKKGGEAATLADFQQFWAGHKGSLGNGEKLAFLMGPNASPTMQHMVAQVKDTFSGAKFYNYRAVNRDNELEGSRLAFGKMVNAQHRFGEADVIVSLDSDFMSEGPNAVRASHDVTSRRKPGDDGNIDVDKLNRLYVVEPGQSSTGAQADHRFRVRATEVADVALGLAAELDVLKGQLAQAVAGHKDHGFTRDGKNWVGIIARDLLAHRGKCLVVAGSRQPAIVHAVVHAINDALGNVGTTVTYTDTPAMAAQPSSLADLTAAIDAGNVDTLFILGGNPVFDAPADLDLKAKIESVPNSVHLGLFYDETAAACSWHVNGTHTLEAWGDARAFDGTASIVQPLIAPLYAGVSEIEMLAQVADYDEKEGYQVVRYYWEDNTRTEDFDAWWNRAVHDGLVHGSASASAQTSLQAAQIASAVSGHQKAAAGSLSNLEVTFAACPTLYDGRYRNNAWMQECPDPTTKLTWDNAAVMSRGTAQALNVGNGDMLELTVSGRKQQLPAWIVPGHADHSISLTLGYTQNAPEEFLVAKGTGFDVGVLRTTGAMDIANGSSAAKTGGTYKLESTQDHGSMEGRPLYREGDAKQYSDQANFAQMESPLAVAADLMGETEEKKLKSLWEERNYSEGYQWGMVIDLNSCNGCNACVVACQSENNIPSVGKTEVGNGREMHWLRIDRYYGSDLEETSLEKMNEDHVDAVHQPVPCMQCENAPCESVCPVAATVHSPDGLNDMAYNRCIGTRYCSNNCPYKVRRFNWFDFVGKLDPTLQMAQNPDVTVRARGVMEKCTYCVQRISGAKHTAKREARLVRDGEIVPACGQVCPSQAITFGNITDENSRVSKLRASSLNYAMLSELNVKPRTTYLAKIRNPNPELS